MPAPTEPPRNDASVFMIFGAVSVVLIGLLVWQPRATIWIADAVEADGYVQSTDQAASVGPGGESKRKPIDAGEWAHVFNREDVAHTASR